MTPGDLYELNTWHVCDSPYSRNDRYDMKPGELAIYIGEDKNTTNDRFPKHCHVFYSINNMKYFAWAWETIEGFHRIFRLI